MNDFLLFIDTEASDKPKKWNVPYGHKNNWPFAVQISWLVYTKNGKEIKRENHYIKDGDFKISRSSQKIHGITHNFLSSHGENRKAVMAMLADDLIHFHPLVLGHFMELDYHITGAEFYRSGLENQMAHLPTFCTMLATTHLVDNPFQKYLRLNDLYELLFHSSISNYHNALADAEATANCFFELLKRGEIDEEKIVHQSVMNEA